MHLTNFIQTLLQCSVIKLVKLYQKIIKLLFQEMVERALGGYKRISLMLKRRTLPNSFINFLNKIYPNHYGSSQEILYRKRDSAMSYASFEDNNLLNLLNLNPADRYSEFFKESGNDYKNLLLSDYKFYSRNDDAKS